MRGDNQMNGTVELWSQPWHELQRRLAAAAAVYTGMHAVDAGALAAQELKSKPYAGTAMPADSWMMRTRSPVRLSVRPAAR
jgi:hypothetical protein